MTKILVPEDIPSHNKGEAALFYGLKESLKPYGGTDLTLFSLHPDIDRRNYSGEAAIVDARGVTPAHVLDGQGGKITKTFNYLKFMGKHLLFGLLYKCFGVGAANCMPGQVWKAYAEADLILMSHDSFYAPLYHGTQALLFRLMRKPAVIYAATVKRKGSDKTSLKARLMDAWSAYTLRKLTGISLREDYSKAYLDEIGVTDRALPVAVHPDLAFIVAPSDKEAALNLLRREGVPENPPLIGMAVSQRKLDFAFPDQKIPDRHNQALAPIIEAVNYLTDIMDATVVFIPHSIGPTAILDDRITADRIRDRHDSRTKSLSFAMNIPPSNSRAWPPVWT